MNIAARLQALARAGGLCVSGVRSGTENPAARLHGTRCADGQEHLGAGTRLSGERERQRSALGEDSSLGDGKPLALPDKLSIAVLPFQNMSGDPEQEYFADGMVEDIVRIGLPE